MFRGSTERCITERKKMEKSISEMSYRELMREFLRCSDLAQSKALPLKERKFYYMRCIAIKEFMDEYGDELQEESQEQDLLFLQSLRECN